MLLVLPCGVIAASDPDRVRLAVDDTWFGPIYVVSETSSPEGIQHIIKARLHLASTLALMWSLSIVAVLEARSGAVTGLQKRSGAL